MADRKEDISVRIVADYTKAMADVQRFTGAVEGAFSKLPKVVQDLTATVDKLTESIMRVGRSDGVDQLERKLKRSNNEAKSLSTTFDKLLLSGKAIGAAVTAWQAGKMVLQGPVNDTMDYGMRLTHATNVTAPGASLDAKLRLMTEIDTRLNAARHAGGGTRGDVLSGFESLMARNSIGDKDQTLSVMPGIAKTATAGNASFEDMAKTSSGLIKSLGVQVTDNEKALAQLFYAGQDGGFELKNMAHYLPSQAASAKNAGLSGLSAVSKIAALNEMAIDASGTPDQAGINVNDFLNSMNSSHLANNLKRFSFDKANQSLVYNDSKRKGGNYLDLGHQLAENAGNGVDAIDTMIQLTGMAVKGDPTYAAAIKKRDAARQRLNTAKERGDTAGQVDAQKDITATMDSVVQILEGRGIGKLFHNQQEMRGAIGVLTNPQAYHDKVIDYQARGTIANRDNALEFIKAQPGFKAQMFGEDKAAALYTGMEGFNGWLGKLADGASALYEKHPALAAAMEGGKLAVTTMAAAAGGAAVALALLTKNATAAAVAQGGGAGAGAGAAGAAGAVPGFKANLMSGLKWGGLTSAILAGVEGYGIYNSDQLTAQQKKIGYTGAAGGAAGGALGGAGLGAAAGSFFPGIGTIVGGLIGAGLGSWGGHSLGTAAGQAMFGDAPAGKIQTFSENAAVRRQMVGFDSNTGAVSRALESAYKPAPIEARLKLDLSFNENGQLVVKQKSLSGNMRLDTGPMMAH